MSAAALSFRAQRSWASLGQEKPSDYAQDGWSPADLPDLDEFQESVAKGWSSLRQAVYNNAPSMPAMPSTSYGSAVPRSASRSPPLPPAAQAAEQAATVQSDAPATSLWSRVSEAVNHSWESKFTLSDDFDDLEVGKDGDTHLTRILKEYHASRATSARDLPPWLFTAEQRSTSYAWDDDAASTTRASNSRRPGQGHGYQQAAVSNSNSLQDIFQAESAPRKGRPQRQPSNDSGYESGSSSYVLASQNTGGLPSASTRAATRLQSMKREGRARPNPAASALVNEMPSQAGPRSGRSAAPAGGMRAPPASRGLPSRPRGNF